MGKRERKKGECRRARREEVGRKEKQMRRYLAGKKTKIWKWNTPRKKKNRRIEERRKEKGEKCEVV